MSPRPKYIDEKMDAIGKALEAEHFALDSANQRHDEVRLWDEIGKVAMGQNPEREGIAPISLRGSPIAGAPSTRRFRGEVFVRVSPIQGIRMKDSAQQYAYLIRRLGRRYRIVRNRGAWHVYRGGARMDDVYLDSRIKIEAAKARDLIAQRRRQR